MRLAARPSFTLRRRVRARTESVGGHGGGASGIAPPQPDLRCPSAPPEPGNSLLGVVAGPSDIAYVTPAVPLDAAFLQRLGAIGTRIENRFRFSGPCFREKCAQWSGARCGLIDRVLSAIDDEVASKAALPRCGIRTTCRWFAQRGTAACHVCSHVIRDPVVAATDDQASRKD